MTYKRKNDCHDDDDDDEESKVGEIEEIPLSCRASKSV